MHIAEKSFLKTYINGFLSGFNCIANFWRPINFEEKTLDEMNKDLIDLSWFQTANDFKNACLQVEKIYGIKNDAQ
ncbi:MAG: hypothetical protein Ta2D_03150 [Rickettsiales bacterium]|nr:MAG: hypothetical protein Ta2D_03150 [Rickettsiales bacterium]